MKYLTITSPDINNGTALRVTLWVVGCSHHCKGCQNPHTWNYNQGNDISNALEQINKEIDKHPGVIKGLTISGGDPLAQSHEDLDLLHTMMLEFKIEHPDMDIWLYSGYTYEEAIKDEYRKMVLSLCDVMVDGKFCEEKKDTTLAFRGSSNQRIIDLGLTELTGMVAVKEMDVL